MPSEMQERIAIAISGAPFPTASSRRKALAVMKVLREPTPTALAATVRECARITAPWVTDIEFAELKVERSPTYVTTEDDMRRLIAAVFDAEIAAAGEPSHG